MQARHASVVHAFDLCSKGLCGDRGFLRHRQIRCSCAYDGDQAGWRGVIARARPSQNHQAGNGVVPGAGKRIEQQGSGGRRHSRREDRGTALLE